MHTRRVILKIFPILSIAFFIVSSAFAGNNAGFVSSFREDNENIFERSDVRMAVEHFCRMLSIDPKDKTVQENLEAIVVHPELTAAQRSDVFLLEDHLSYIKNLQGRVEYLTSKRNLLRDQLIENGHEREVLLKGLFDIRKNISGSHQTSSYQERSLSDRKSSLAVINGLLVGEKVRLSVRVRSLQNQYDWLNAVNKEEKHLSSRYFVEKIDAGNVSVHPSGDGERQGNETNTEEFKKELGVLYVQIDKLEDRITKEDDRISGLESQVVDLSLKLSETEILLNEKTEAVESLTMKLVDIEQRFMLGQRIVHEKDEEMRSLQKDLQKTRLETESRAAKHDRVIAEKDKDLKVANGFLNIYRERSEGRREDEKLNELSGILMLYKDKLSEEAKAARKKSADIVALEVQLMGLSNRLNEKNKALVKTQRELQDLGGQLTVMKEKLLRLRERPQESGPHNSDVDDQVRELQSRFRDINDFLLENLHDSDRIKTHLTVQ